MMTPLELVDELAAYLPVVVADMQLEIPKKPDERRPPQVVPGWLPTKDPKNPDRVEDFPIVLVRFAGHDDTAPGESTVRVHIFVGTYSESPEGWRDTVNVIERIRQAFLEKRTVAQKFRLELPMKSTVPTEEPPMPYWIGYLETRWTIAQPIEEVLINGEQWP